jgi:adenylosuccinate synthase
MMKLDVLDELDPILVCTGYRYRGKVLTEFPSETAVLAECQPVYETLPGWKQSTVGVMAEEELPAKCQAYIRRLETLVGIPLTLVSTGPRRDQTIVRANAVWREWGLA